MKYSRLGLVVLALLSLAPSKPAIALSLDKRVCLSPCAVEARIRIEPHELNRWYVAQITYVGDDIALQSSARQIEPGDSPTQRPITFQHLADGHYVVLAVLYRATNPSEAARTWTTVCVGGVDACAS